MVNKVLNISGNNMTKTSVMKVLWCWALLGLSAVQAAESVRKRVHNAFEIVDEQKVDKKVSPRKRARNAFEIMGEQKVDKRVSPRGLEADIAEELRRLLEIELQADMSMSMPVDPPTPAEIDPPTPPTRVSPSPTATPRALLVKEKCGITELERSRDILSILYTISLPVDLVTPDSPQYKARDWIDHVDDAIVCANKGDRISQRYIAALLYYQLGGDDWFNCRAQIDSDFNDLCLEDARRARKLEHNITEGDLLDNSVERAGVRFLDELNECEWFGFSCGLEYDPVAGNDDDAYFPIQGIDLSDNNLAGNLFNELFNLMDLEFIKMDGNRRISGSIPEVVGNLTKLRELDLDDNALTGVLPDALYSMTQLQAIDLNDNQLHGELSEEIGNLENLGVLQLDNNLFEGPVPVDGLFSLLQLGT